LKQKVIRFAPFEKVSEIWNPILTIRANPDTNTESKESTPEEEEDARYLTNLLITPSGSGDASFWENSAKNLVLPDFAG
jgi:type IV secretory pathway TraG/TraD family ATPase VirD4